MIDFAKFVLAKKDELEPWGMLHGDEMHPSPSAFGAVSESTTDVQYEFMLLTKEEYEKHMGITLDPKYDPGPEFFQTFGTTANNVLAFLVDTFPVRGILLDWLSDNDAEDQVAHWLRYYSARGGATIIYPNGEPTDAPWADKLHSDWCDAVNNRIFEVEEIRNEIDFVVPLLAEVAEEYADTDLNNAIGIASRTDIDVRL